MADHRTRLVAACVAASLALLPALADASLVYSEDFEGFVLTDPGNTPLPDEIANTPAFDVFNLPNDGGELGQANPSQNSGDATPFGFNQFAEAVAATAPIGIVLDDGSGTNNVLQIDSGPAVTRGVGIILDPALFPSAGQYVLTFDAELSFPDTTVTPEANFQFAVWEGTNIGPDPLSAEDTDPALVLDLLDNTGPPAGVDLSLEVVNPGASGIAAAQIAVVEFGVGDAGVLEGVTITFDYSGGDSAIALILQSQFGALVQLDNILVIPEPTSATLAMAALVAVASRRRR